MNKRWKARTFVYLADGPIVVQGAAAEIFYRETLD
jgi:hypothetical protein